jgi:hypothetical protein
VIIKKQTNKSSLPSIEQNYRKYDDFEINEKWDESNELALKVKRRSKRNPERQQINEFEERNSFGSDTMLYPNIKKYEEDYANLDRKFLSRKLKSGSKKHLRLKLKLNKSKQENFDEQDC